MYPDYDYLHIGEMGDATDQIIGALDASAARPPRQVVAKTKDRLPLTEFPIPAYEKVPFGRYLLGTLQFSSGCPYMCEFCDIPGLYGRQPRMKTPAQIVAELDFIFSRPNPPRRSISSMTISSAIARPQRRCCRISSIGRSAIPIR